LLDDAAGDAISVLQDDLISMEREDERVEYE
jgi:hypothetical protein